MRKGGRHHIRPVAPGGRSISRRTMLVVRNPRRASATSRKRHTGEKKRGFLRRLTLKHYMSCAGVVVLMGCFTFVMTPEEDGRPGLPFTFGQRTPTIVLDAGHGGKDDGARFNGLREADLNLAVAKRVAVMLKELSYEIVMTRTDDTFIGLKERSAIANDHSNSIFVSIHFNAHASGAVSGIETFYSVVKRRPEWDWKWIGLFSEPLSAEAVLDGEALAGYIQAALISKTSLRNRGIKSRDLSVTRNVYGPAVLVEAGFISNRMEAAMLRNEDYKQRLAAGITEGILQFVKTKAEQQQDVSEPARFALGDPVAIE
jgi:N-acetylmuramoyl-L-alanine amidase